jgi:hypothetical protein
MNVVAEAKAPVWTSSFFECSIARGKERTSGRGRSLRGDMRKIASLCATALLLSLSATAAFGAAPPPPATDPCKPFLGATVCPVSTTLTTRTGAGVSDYYGAISAKTSADFAVPAKRSFFVRMLGSLIDFDDAAATKIEVELILSSDLVGTRSLGKYLLLGFNLDDGNLTNVSGQVTVMPLTRITPYFPLRGAKVLAIFRTTVANSTKLSLTALLNKAKPLAAAIPGSSALLTAATPVVAAITDFIDQAAQSQYTRTVEYDTYVNFEAGRQNAVTFELNPETGQPSFKLTLTPELKPSLLDIPDPVGTHAPIANPEGKIIIADDTPKTLSAYLAAHGVPVTTLDLKPTVIAANDPDADKKITAAVEQSCSQLYAALTTNIPLNEFDVQAVLHSRVERASLSAAALTAPCISTYNKPGGEWDTFGFGLIPPPPDGSIPVATVDNAKDDLGKLAAALSMPTPDLRKGAISTFVVPTGSRFLLTAPRELTPKGADDQGPAPDGKRVQSLSTAFFSQVHSCALGDYFKRTDNAVNQVSFLLLPEGIAKIYVGTASYLKAANGGFLLSELEFHALDQDDFMKTKDGDRPVKTDNAAFQQTAFGQNKAVKDFLKDGAAPMCGGS